MNITQKDIDQLTYYARNIMKGAGDAQPEDVVQDVIIQMLEGDGFIFHEAKELVRKLAYGEKDARTNNSPNAFSKHDTTRTCKICKDDLPIALFRILSYKCEKKKKIISAYCNDCETQYDKERYLKKIGRPLVYKKHTPIFNDPVEERKYRARIRAKDSYNRKKAARLAA